MGKKKYATINGRTQTLSEWARELGVSRQMVSRQYVENRLEDYVTGERSTGRPRTVEIQEKLLKDTMDLPASEVSEMTGLPVWAVYYYRKQICGK